MAEYIKREDAVRAIDVQNIYHGIIVALQEILCDIPAADVRPVVKAHWIYHEDDYGDYYECSNCHDEYVVYESDMTWKYCPTCGAKMEV